MINFKNESAHSRRVIHRVHRHGADQPSAIVLLPGQEADVDESIYELTDTYQLLGDSDKARCRELGIPYVDTAENPHSGSNPDPEPDHPHPQTGTLADGAAAEQGSLLGAGIGSGDAAGFQNQASPEVAAAAQASRDRGETVIESDAQLAEALANPQPARQMSDEQALQEHVEMERAAAAAMVAEGSPATPAP